MNHIKQELINDFGHVHTNFNKALSQFDEAQLNRAPIEGSWTAGQVADHIIKSKNGILKGLLHGKSTETDRPYDEQVKVIQGIFRGNEKSKTAPFLEPDQPRHHLDNLLDTLKEQLAQQIEVIQTTDLTASGLGSKYFSAEVKDVVL